MSVHATFCAFKRTTAKDKANGTAKLESVLSVSSFSQKLIFS